MQVPPFDSLTSLVRVLVLVPVPHSAEQFPTTQLSHSQWTAETEIVSQEVNCRNKDNASGMCFIYLMKLSQYIPGHVSHSPGHLVWTVSEQQSLD